MAFARSKANASGECIRNRYTELSDVIRARNHREDRLLNVRLKFYEREKNIRLNFIRMKQSHLERVRRSLCEEAKKIQEEKQNPALPSWRSNGSKLEDQLLQLSIPEFIFTDWEIDSNEIQSAIIPFTKPDLLHPPKEVLRRHSAR